MIDLSSQGEYRVDLIEQLIFHLILKDKLIYSVGEGTKI